jgi:hypothetical protein
MGYCQSYSLSTNWNARAGVEIFSSLRGLLFVFQPELWTAKEFEGKANSVPASMTRIERFGFSARRPATQFPAVPPIQGEFSARVSPSDYDLVLTTDDDEIIHFLFFKITKNHIVSSQNCKK